MRIKTVSNGTIRNREKFTFLPIYDPPTGTLAWFERGIIHEEYFKYAQGGGFWRIIKITTKNKSK